MIVDLHAHYAMHLVEELHPHPLRALRSALSPASDALVKKLGALLSAEEQLQYDRHRRRRRRRAILRSLFSWINATFNYRSPASGPGVTLELMKKGGVGVVLSPLLDPFNEFGSLPGWILAWALLAAAAVLLAVFAVVAHSVIYLLLAALALVLALLVVAVLAILNWRASLSGSALDELPGSPPREEYFQDLLFQLESVEQDILALSAWARVAHNYNELTKARKARKIAVIHAVEGGFQLGASEQTIQRHVALLAQRGVAYVTLAHLLYRRIATNAPAIPILSDGIYNILAPQPSEGLTELGEAAIRAMFCNGILIDVTHMSEPAITATLCLLEELEEKYAVATPVPVLATHIACRFGTYEYNLSDDTIREIGKRNGLMGVIFCDHWMHDGPSRRNPRGERETFERLKENIDRIARLISSHKCTAIGSDLDGFIKPMLRGLEDMAGMSNLENWLRTEYPADADLILSGNALRVLKSAWRRPKCKGKTP
ncbi:MAG TPA: membrane dipeptidase [Gemmatimonadales bacterium]|nr:membrane dipeptidase [Gemmatimonadales bacterium]